MCRRIVWIVGVIVLVFYSAAFPTTVSNAQQTTILARRAFEGIWRGTVSQQNPTMQYSVDLTLIQTREHTIAGTSAYPELLCGGELTLSHANNASLELHEHITYGNCVDAMITVTLVNTQTLQYSVRADAYPTWGTASLAKSLITTRTVEAKHIGVWTGQASGPAGSYTILVTVIDAAPSDVVAAIAYPSLKCGGFWTLGSTHGDILTAHEALTFGLSRCVQTGTVTLTYQNDGTLHYKWESSHTDNGNLTRISPMPSDVSFFSQNDPEWAAHPLRSPNGACSRRCPTIASDGITRGTIGECGCALTASVMAFDTYGASTTPPVLSDDLDTAACPLDWSTAISHSGNAVRSALAPLRFDYDDLDDILNEDRRVVLVELTRGELTHWVLVHHGQGNEPANYSMNDPWYTCGANRALSQRTQLWTPSRMRIFEPTTPAVAFNSPDPPCASRIATARPVSYTVSGLGSKASNYTPVPPAQSVSSATISGTISLFSSTALTTTVEVTATSTAGAVTEMLIWSDKISNTHWQEFYPLVWLPAQDTVYARFRDSAGNNTGVYSATLLVAGPPLEPWRLFLPHVRR